MSHGVAAISSLLTIIGLFCRTQSLLWGSSAKETYNSKEPTNRSHSARISTFSRVKSNVSRQIPSIHIVHTPCAYVDYRGFSKESLRIYRFLLVLRVETISTKLVEKKVTIFKSLVLFKFAVGTCLALPTHTPKHMWMGLVRTLYFEFQTHTLC